MKLTPPCSLDLTLSPVYRERGRNLNVGSLSLEAKLSVKFNLLFCPFNLNLKPRYDYFGVRKNELVI
jgi:hypothetical protein